MYFPAYICFENTLYVRRKCNGTQRKNSRSFTAQLTHDWRELTFICGHKHLNQCRFVMPSPRQSCWLYLYLSLSFPEKWCDSELGFPQGNSASEGLGYKARDNPETKPQEAQWIMHKQHRASDFLPGDRPVVWDVHTPDPTRGKRSGGQGLQCESHCYRNTSGDQTCTWSLSSMHILVLHSDRPDRRWVEWQINHGVGTQFNYGICSKSIVVEMVINTPKKHGYYTFAIRTPWFIFVSVTLTLCK